MEDRELYATILGVRDPWTVERVELDAKGERVDVWLGYERGSAQCPECDAAGAVHDHRERAWRHLDTCQFETRLHARVPRVNCAAHGVKQVRVPWAEKGSQFTALFERLAIDWLREATVSAVARRMRLSWDEVWGIQKRAVRRGLERRGPLEPIFVGVDEKSFRRRHHYATLVNDIIDARVLYVAEGRTQESLEPFYREELTAAARENLTAIAMDMWEPFIQTTLREVPQAADKIVFDKFHVAKHLNEAVDKVRRREQRDLRSQGDPRLTHTKYWWLKTGPLDDATLQRQFCALRNSDLKVARAWSIKETAMNLWSYESKTWAHKFFKRWFFWATHSRLKPVVDVARMMKRRLHNLLTYIDFPITNAASESINATVQTIKSKARGFRNFDNFRTAIFFHCGGLDLYPH